MTDVCGSGLRQEILHRAGASNMAAVVDLATHGTGSAKSKSATFEGSEAGPQLTVTWLPVLIAVGLTFLPLFGCSKGATLGKAIVGIRVHSD